jgi:hypothetical protein
MSKKIISKPKSILKGKLKIEPLSSITSKNGKIKKRSIKYSRVDGKNITYAYAKDIYKTVLLSGVKAKDVYVQVMSHQILTIKSLGEEDFKDWESEEYYEDRVADASDFVNNIKYIRITIMEQ